MFQAIGAVVLLFVLGFVWDLFFIIGRWSLVALAGVLVTDILLLFRIKKGIHAVRVVADKLSNGDENEIRIYLESFYSIPLGIKIIDEIPHQFQKRNIHFDLTIQPGTEEVIRYDLRPTKRGEYNFGAVNIFATSVLGLASRRFRFSEDQMVPVYPSYLQMRKYELLAISNNLTEYGIKKIRRIGHNMEFEQIKEYVMGDDYRTVNWKATARRGQLMVNTFQDEKAQQVYSLIDKGRVMQMPFDGLSLLDYAINASLVISNIAVMKGDKAGLITFQHKIGTVLPAGKRNNQMGLIQEVLYNQKTAYRESDFSRLFSAVNTKIKQRSLLLLFSNLETLASMHRQLPYLRRMAKRHVLVVIFFENTALKELQENDVTNLRSVYYKTVAEKYVYEKKLVAKELNQHGIHTVLTTPADLSVNTINKYLELKARGLI